MSDTGSLGCFDVEVAYALPQRQIILKTSVNVGVSMIEAVQISGILDAFPEIDLETISLGVFSKRILKPETYVLRPGDRIEIYRPLIADPKEIRKQRALKAAEKKEQSSKA